MEKMALSKITTYDLQVVEAGQFITQLFTDVKTAKLDLKEDEEINAGMDELQTILDDYNKALQQIRARQESLELAELDRQRDRKIFALNAQVNAYSYTDDAKERTFYQKAIIILDKYGNLAKANYEIETLGINNLLVELKKPENKDMVTALHLDLPMKNLEVAGKAFELKFSTRSVNVAADETFDVKILKAQMFEAYKTLAAYVLAMAKKKTALSFHINLLNIINTIRNYFANVIAQRQGRGGNDTDAPTGDKPVV